MDVWNHVGFSKITLKPLWDYIQVNNIPVHNNPQLHMASIQMYSSNPHWPWIESYLRSNNKRWISDTIFSKEELQQAQWMYVRSEWVTGYPQPMDGFGYETITYTREDHCKDCGIGLEQVDCFRMTKAPSWDRRHFFSLFWVSDELFVSEAVKNAFCTDGITGVEFIPVKNKSGTKEFEGIFQLRIHHVLEEGLILDERTIRSTTVCDKCGRRKSWGNDGVMLQFKRQIFDNAPDIVKTGDNFGVAGNKSSERRIVISQKVYQCIVKHNLGKNLMFYPIELV
ncbi:MAG: hypothetical protein IJO56_02195 [Oscillospiraceae bacterium]|nr:hypothetical protein [Oscillospiraceae bacterium]